MIAPNFTATHYGKWILAGEHSVLRGSPALAFPLKGLELELKYWKSEKSLHVEFSGKHGEELQLLFFGVLEKALENLKIDRGLIRGEVSLFNQIPIGAGLGASAALCVAVSRWLGHLGYIPEKDHYEFSRNLENLFHGESSGVDIAVSLLGTGIRFLREGEKTPLRLNWQPQLYVSYTGKRGVTSECVAKVKALIAKDPDEGALIDYEMRRAVALCEKALCGKSLFEKEIKKPESEERVLKEALDLAQSCFDRWNLSSPPVRDHMKDLLMAGALSVKPTGSGDGGYVLSYWKDAPPDYLRSQLISCF
ncbi:MAG: mevalonate kinase [Pseudobdellovibrionaceae bacterium]